MKRLVALLMALGLLAGCPAVAQDQPIVVGGDQASVALGEKISMEDVCDITFIDWVAGEYATSIPVWERPDDQVIKITSAASTRDCDGQATKYEDRGYAPEGGYLPSYVAKGLALKASSKEYKLVDVRMAVINTQLKEFVFQDAASAQVCFLDKYEFPGQIYMETTDDVERVNEWLVAPTPIPMLVTRTVHLVFEVPNAVVDSKDSLVMTMNIAGQSYTLKLR